jgi:two-component system, chemotaxis family, chemotaxis protein CheY
MLKKYKILSVDDSTFIRRHVKKIFSDYNVEIVEAENGLAGLERAKSLPDLILLDITMPEMDGIEMLRQLRLDPDCRHIPVIMVSAELTSSSMIKMAKAGSNDCLPKPFTPEDLIAKAQKQLKGGLLCAGDRIASIVKSAGAELTYQESDCLLVNFPNLEPDVVISIMRKFPKALEEAINQNAKEVFFNLKNLQNADIILLVCLHGLISAVEVRGLKASIFSNQVVKNYLDIYPNTDKWKFYIG